MRNKLLATVAVAAVVGFGGFAAAQSQMGGESSKSTSGATSGTSSGATQQKSGTQSGSKLSPSSTQSSNPSRNESAQSGKNNERLGQGQKTEERNESKTGQAHGNEQQKGAQQDRGLKNRKGAQEERGERGMKGAQEERGTKFKGAQEERGERGMKGAREQRGTTERNATEQNGRNGVNVGERGERGGSVQLSQDQRSQIKTIVGRGNAPRFSGNVDFDIRVGSRVPRSVHFVALPEDIVRIVPQYRGYDYVLVRDEILIIDPSTLEIVAVIPA
jgi:uncharacterized protein DUF1236